VKPLQISAIACGAIFFGVMAALGPLPDEPARLNGVSVDLIWQGANFINPEFLSNQPTFVRQGSDFVGTASLNALKPNTNEPMGVDITWRVSALDDDAPLRSNFRVPSDAQYVVTAHLDYQRTHAAVDTFSVVSARSGNLIPQPLGFKKSDGTIVAADANLARGVFEALGIHGPFTNTIIIQP
jgi:hypothetical protein